MQTCEFFRNCGFYHKFSQKNSVAWRGLFDTYCHGRLCGHCERYKLYLEQSRTFSDEMMPNGQAVPPAFKLLQ